MQTVATVLACITMANQVKQESLLKLGLFIRFELTSSSEHSSLSILVRRAIMQSAEASCSGGADLGEERADTANPITGDAWKREFKASYQVWPSCLH